MEKIDITSEHFTQFHHLMGSDAVSEQAKKRLKCILQYLEGSESMADVAGKNGITSGALRRWLNQFDPNDLSTLEEKSSRPKKVRSTNLSNEAVQLIREYRTSTPKIGKQEIAEKLLKEHNIKASASAILRVIERECLYFANSALHRRKRLQAQLALSPSAKAEEQTTLTLTPIVIQPKSDDTPKSGHGTVGRIIAAITAISILCATIPSAQAVTNLLINSESFQTIDAGDATTDMELRFGGSEKIYWDTAKQKFDISDDLHVDLNLTGSGGLAIEENIRAKGNLTINSDNENTNATLTFGNNILAQTFSFISATQKFRFSTSIDVAGTMSGYALTVSGLRNCNTIDTDDEGALSCGTDEGGGGGITQSQADARYVNQAGDTMTGSLAVRGTISGSLLKLDNITTSGSILYSSGSSLRQNAKGLSGQVLISQGTSAPKWAAPIGGMIWYFDGTQAVATSKGPQITMPYNITLSSVLMSIKGAPTGTSLIVDINQNGSTIFATRPQIDDGSTTGGTSAVFSATTLNEGSTITLDIDQVGSTFAGSGLTITLKGTRKY